MLLTIDTALIIEKLILIIVVVSASLVIAMYTTFAERKVAAIIQDRRGPNRAGPLGCFNPWPMALSYFSKKRSFPIFFQIPLYHGPGPGHAYSRYDQCGCSWGDKVQLLAGISPCRSPMSISGALCIRRGQPRRLRDHDRFLGK